MIQDISPHKYHNEYYNDRIENEDFLLLFYRGEVFVKKTEELDYFRFQEVFGMLSHIIEEIHYAFSIDEEKYFVLEIDASVFEILNLPEWKAKGEFHNPQIFRQKNPMWKSFAGITACQLNRWYQNEKFCSRCAEKLIPHKTERALECPSCKKLRYPVISPCVIVAVTHGNRLLLTKYTNSHSSYRKYALIAGFAEVGESIEETVCREVKEEVGLSVKNLRFYKSQPWSFTDTLLFGFYAELDGSDNIQLEEEELSEAEWFERDQIPVTATGTSLTNEMIENFRLEKYPVKDLQNGGEHGYI